MAYSAAAVGDTVVKAVCSADYNYSEDTEILLSRSAAVDYKSSAGAVLLAAAAAAAVDDKDSVPPADTFPLVSNLAEDIDLSIRHN